jgi:hypothetical protein
MSLYCCICHVLLHIVIYYHNCTIYDTVYFEHCHVLHVIVWCCHICIYNSVNIFCHVLSFLIKYCDQYCIQNCSKNLTYLKTMVEDWLLSSANIPAALLGMYGAMDDIPLFCPASTQVWQAWRAYHCSKKLMLVSLISDEDFAQIFAASLHCLAITVP